MDAGKHVVMSRTAGRSGVFGVMGQRLLLCFHHSSLRDSLRDWGLPWLQRQCGILRALKAFELQKCHTWRCNSFSPEVFQERGVIPRMACRVYPAKEIFIKPSASSWLSMGFKWLRNEVWMSERARESEREREGDQAVCDCIHMINWSN